MLRYVASCCSGGPPDLLSFPTRRSSDLGGVSLHQRRSTHLHPAPRWRDHAWVGPHLRWPDLQLLPGDRKSTRLNSSHVANSYADFCLKKKQTNTTEIEEIAKTIQKAPIN